MKRLLLLATVFASVLLSSCSKTEIGNDTPNVIPENKGINFSGTTIDTKATMDPNTYKFSWVGGTDKIGIVAKNATEFYTPNSVEYTVTTTGASSPFSSATGIEWNGTGEHTFYASSPVGAFANSKFSFDLPQTQTQSAAGNHDHVGASAIMFAKATAQANQEDAIALAFKHQMAFMEFRVSAATGNTLTISSIKVEAPSIYASKISYDLATEAVTAETPANALSLGLTTGMPVATAVQKGWLAVLPGTYTSLKFTITYSDGQTQVIEKTPKAPATSFIIKAAALLPVGLTAAPVGGGEVDPTPEPIALCSTEGGDGTWGQLSGFTVGDKTIALDKTAEPYIDGTAITIANVSAGNTILVGARNNTTGSERIHSAAYVDWDLNGTLNEAEERVGYTPKTAVAGSTTLANFLSFSLTAPVGTPSGKYFMRVYVSHDDNPAGCGRIESRTAYDLAINYTSNEDPNAPSYCSIKANDGLTVKVDGANVVKNFTISLTKKVASDVIVNLAATSDTNENGTLSVQQVTIPAGQKTATASITFSTAVFGLDTKADVTVTATPNNTTGVEASPTTSSIKYIVKGPMSAQDIGLRLTADFNGVYDFATMEKNGITMSASSTATPEVEPILDFSVSGTLTKADIRMEWAGTYGSDTSTSPLYPESNYGYTYIYLEQSAKGKTGTITFTSTNTILPTIAIIFTEIK